ncbi:hypothetical protein [Peribacillus frigoritolerans]|uniref:hypothetical protein n=1 Tax=Peribacillus frigoritolerans TaxID=450367 RepID=UPI0024C19938|nr:hypothetical protein [Peribacillus frigoritolerans]MEB2493725.1 hypothetical protein [Peribacillus frigoritolerans]WHX62360.1 hypothetical protein QNH33_01740 [Peribacillus frigoritolerans]
MNVFKYELYNCIRRKELHFVLIFMLLVSMLAFVIECIAFYGKDLSLIRSAAESSILQGTYASTVKSTLLLIIPLLCSLVYADSFYVDYKTGSYKNIITRTSTTKYVFVKAIVVFISTVTIFFITLTVNQLLCFITFPLVGFDNIYSLPTFDIGVQNYNELYLFDLLRIESPYMYNLTFIIIISIFSGLFSLLAYSVYFMFLSKIRIVGVMVIFVLYIVFNIVLSMLGFYNFSLFNQLSPNHIGSLLEISMWALFIFVISLYFLINKGLKKEWGIED